MRFGKAIWLGILLWIFIFIEISITMIGLGLSDFAVWAIHYVLLIPVVILIARNYYGSKDRVNGFVLGLVIVVVGIILDAIVTVPLFGSGDYGTYYSQGTLWVGIFEAIVICGVYDILRKPAK